MNHADSQYLAALTRLLYASETRTGRNGLTHGFFGHSMRFDMRDGFPLLTTKRLSFKSIKCELIWILRGLTNVKWLQERGVTIWDEWADSNGELGPVYGAQMRDYNGEGFDQLETLIHDIKNDPFSRRHVMTLWNPAELNLMKLPPCHGIAIQFHVSEARYISCAMYQRSADWFLGVPFNIASYALFLHLVARETGYVPGSLFMAFGDVHLYDNHREAAETQLARSARELPTIHFAPDAKNLFAIEPEDIVLSGYNPWDSIKAEVSK